MRVITVALLIMVALPVTANPIEDFIDKELPESTDFTNFLFDGITGATPKDCSEFMDATRQNYVSVDGAENVDEAGKLIQTAYAHDLLSTGEAVFTYRAISSFVNFYVRMRCVGGFADIYMDAASLKKDR